MGNFNRRCHNHDYKAPFFYHITITCKKGTPILSDLKCDGGKVDVVLTPLGQIVDKWVRHLDHLHPELWTICHKVMPDHVHFLVRVHDYIPKHLGKYIGLFKSKCSSEWGKVIGSDAVQSIFDSGFNDRIVFKRGQKDRIKSYIEDNPRKLWIKRNNPDLFKRYMCLEIDGREYAAYGNIFLLKDHEKEPVIVRSAWSEKEKDEYAKDRLRCAGNGGVLISPFISKDEKKHTRCGS